MKMLSYIGSSVETMSVLINSNVSKDGFFRRNIIEKENKIQLAGDWESNILHGTTFRRMDQNFLNTVISILGENINRFCCFILKANRIKTEGSRKGNVPFLIGVVKCSFSVSAKENYH